MVGGEQRKARAGPELVAQPPSAGNDPSCKPGPFPSNPLCQQQAGSAVQGEIGLKVQPGMDADDKPGIFSSQLPPI